MAKWQRRKFILGLASLTLAGPAIAADKIKLDAASALIVVGVQNCFLPGGSLAVRDGDQVIPVINRIAKGFITVVITQDWHTPPPDSFDSSPPGKKPFDIIKLPYGDQTLWPDHCVQGSAGAAIAKDLDIANAALIVRLGSNRDMDSYSAFLEADKKTHTEAAGHEQGIEKIEHAASQLGGRLIPLILYQVSAFGGLGGLNGETGLFRGRRGKQRIGHKADREHHENGSEQSGEQLVDFVGIHTPLAPFSGGPNRPLRPSVSRPALQSRSNRAETRSFARALQHL